MATFLVDVALPAHADDWPQWRGRDREGVWREEGIVNSFPAAPLPVRWKVPLGYGYSGPAVVGDRVYVTDRIVDDAAPKDVKTQWNHRDKTIGRERVVCLDEATGKIIWKHAYDTDYSLAYGSGPRATPTVHEGKVYALGAMGDLFCLDAAKGTVIWQKNFVRDYGADVPTYGFASAPLVDGDRLIAMVGGKGQAVVAFDRNTGRELWKSDNASEPGYCAPMIRTLGGTRQLIAWHADAISGLDPVTGKVLWTHPHHLMAGMAISSPAIEGQRMVICSQYEGTLMFEFTAGNAQPKLLWKAFAGTVPEKQWKTKGFNTTLSTVLLMKNHVYGVSLYGETCCLDGDTGNRLWTTLQPTSGGTVPKDRWSTLFMVPHGGNVFIFSEKGDLIATRLKPTGYEEIGRTHIIDPDMPSGSGRLVVWSHPAFAHRSIYARNDREMVCVSLSAANILAPVKQ